MHGFAGKIFALSLVAVGYGCSPQPEGPKVGADVWASPHAENVRHVSSVMAAEGMPPLVLQAGQSGMIHVVDQKTGKTIASGMIYPQLVVEVSAEKGVMIGGAMYADPVPADHSYAIVMDIDNPEWKPEPADSNKK
jgi:hypothetical protein